MLSFGDISDLKSLILVCNTMYYVYYSKKQSKKNLPKHSTPSISEQDSSLEIHFVRKF